MYADLSVVGIAIQFINDFEVEFKYIRFMGPVEITNKVVCRGSDPAN